MMGSSAKPVNEGLVPFGRSEPIVEQLMMMLVHQAAGGGMGVTPEKRRYAMPARSLQSILEMLQQNRPAVPHFEQMMRGGARHQNSASDAGGPSPVGAG